MTSRARQKRLARAKHSFSVPFFCQDLHAALPPRSLPFHFAIHGPTTLHSYLDGRDRRKRHVDAVDADHCALHPSEPSTCSVPVVPARHCHRRRFSTAQFCVLRFIKRPETPADVKGAYHITNRDHSGDACNPTMSTPKTGAARTRTEFPPGTTHARHGMRCVERTLIHECIPSPSILPSPPPTAPYNRSQHIISKPLLAINQHKNNRHKTS